MCSAKIWHQVKSKFADLLIAGEKMKPSHYYYHYNLSIRAIQIYGTLWICYLISEIIQSKAEMKALISFLSHCLRITNIEVLVLCNCQGVNWWIATYLLWSNSPFNVVEVLNVEYMIWFHIKFIKVDTLIRYIIFILWN